MLASHCTQRRACRTSCVPEARLFFTWRLILRWQSHEHAAGCRCIEICFLYIGDHKPSGPRAPLAGGTKRNEVLDEFQRRRSREKLREFGSVELLRNETRTNLRAQLVSLIGIDPASTNGTAARLAWLLKPCDRQERHESLQLPPFSRRG